MSFSELFAKCSWEEIKEGIYSAAPNDVEAALTKGNLEVHDFAALVSPGAAPYLPEILEKSASITRRRFGNTIQMYIPLYLSNECQNICTYCGFSFGNKIPRITLSDKQILEEAQVIRSLGYEHVLLVTGEANKSVGVAYLENAIRLLKPLFAQISIEVQPLETDQYRRLIAAGLYAVLVYQETYHREAYAEYHPKGKKSNFDYRLETPERLGRSGVHKIGLGNLIGLEDWRVEAFFVALHLEYLEKNFWQTRFSISFPRLRPAVGALAPKYNISDRELMQLICAYRIFNENVELSLSTREYPEFRDEAIKIGITSISAGSKTEPGGYAINSNALKQFEISDERTPSEIAAMIAERGLEPVWKDWDQYW
ncbi:MAG: 2-iminoacetate synthase ThiH [Proteobacteria bacterium]|nr:MAG: 2-iminoacetate synthase ThiH [Pseudomonadota bacterium]